MNTKQLKEYIVEPTLERLMSLVGSRYKKIKICTPESVKLILMTAATESNMGRYIVQNNDKMAEEKKAVSIYQIEQPTINFVLKRKSNNLLDGLQYFKKDGQDIRQALISNLSYATAFCRLVYWYKSKDSIPNINDNDGLWKYYKKWYNSSLGDTTRDEFFSACKRYKLI